LRGVPPAHGAHITELKITTDQEDVTSHTEVTWTPGYILNIVYMPADGHPFHLLTGLDGTT